MKPPYLLFLGDVNHLSLAKTAAGIKDWRPELCIGQLRLSAGRVDLGLPDMTAAEAFGAGARTMIVGIANDGGFIAPAWVPAIVAALDTGLDVASGLHDRLDSVPEIAAAATRTGRQLFDVRHPTHSFRPGTGKRRPGKRLLTVGTDCAVGKKYAALAIEKSMRARGWNADFCATGQTGIFISGRGIAVDSVISDFVSGAAEWLSPANDADHWDVIEGQGSLFHPAYAGVTLGLIHGSQPDALVLCHDPRRSALLDFEAYPIPDLGECLAANVAAARLTNASARGVGVALNTAHLSAEEADALMQSVESRLGLPTFDPLRTGADRLVDYLEVQDV